MAFLSFDHGAVLYGSTPVENMFLMEYLPSAPDDCLRVYLYARLLCAYPSRTRRRRGSPTWRARCGSRTRPWRRPFATGSARGWSGAFRTGRPPTRFCPCAAWPSLRRWTGSTISSAILTPPAAPLWRRHPPRRGGDTAGVGHGFRLHGGGGAEDRRIRPGRSAPFAQDAAQGRCGKLDNIAREWRERGARSLADVERFIAEKNGDMGHGPRRYSSACGLRRRPTEDELALAHKWRGWGFDTEAVLAACGETTKASNPSFAYVDRVLEGRYLQTDANFAALREVLRELGASSPAHAGDAQALRALSCRGL